MTEDERPSALLTPSQRAYLAGEKENITDRAKRSNRSNIRERTCHSLVDLHLLNEQLERRDIDQIADSFEMVALGTAIAETVSFLYRLSEAHSKDLEPKKAIERGVKRAREKEMETLYRRFVEGDESLTLSEMKLLEANGYVDRDQIADRIEFDQRSPNPSPEKIADQLE